MAIKLDMSKDYDRISWKFLKFIFHKFHFLDRFIRFIMCCVSTLLSLSLFCVMGRFCHLFSPSRGLWQGDPLSHLLFIICFSRFSAFISRFNTSKSGKGSTHFGHNFLWLTHMAFANDIVLFREASQLNAATIRLAINLFWQGSKQNCS